MNSLLDAAPSRMRDAKIPGLWRESGVHYSVGIIILMEQTRLETLIQAGDVTRSVLNVLVLSVV